MSTTTRSQRFCASPSQPSAPASSSAVPTTSIGAISSRAATRFSRMTGLSSTMNAFSWVMGRRKAKAARRPSPQRNSPQQRMRAGEGHASGTLNGRVSGKAAAAANREAPIVRVGDAPTAGRLLHRASVVGLLLAPRRGRRRAGAARRRLEALHRVVRARRDPHPDAGRGRPPALHRAGPRQHRHPRAGARQRRGRPLSRIHRHDRSRAAEARRQSVARRAQRAGSRRAA